MEFSQKTGDQEEGDSPTGFILIQKQLRFPVRRMLMQHSGRRDVI